MQLCTSAPLVLVCTANGTCQQQDKDLLGSLHITVEGAVLTLALHARVNRMTYMGHMNLLQVYSLEIEPYMLELAQPKFEAAGVADQIEVLVGSATDSIEKLLKRGVCFDIAFLDADKTGYLGYYKQLLDNQLINPGGIIVVDNALMKVCWSSYIFLQFALLPTASWQAV